MTTHLINVNDVTTPIPQIHSSTEILETVMTKQPEALRLAEWLEAKPTIYAGVTEAAAELLRLHAENEELKRDIERYVGIASEQAAQVERQAALLREALAALEKSVDNFPANAQHRNSIAAITKELE